MSFYHTNLDIKLSDITNICNIQNSNFDIDRKFNFFVRPDIATKSDLTFFSSIKYTLKTNANYIITNKNLCKNFSNDKGILVSNNLECDIAKISNLYYRNKTKDEISKLGKPIIGNNPTLTKNTIIENGTTIGNNFSNKTYKPLVGHNTGFNLSILKAKKGLIQNLIFNKPTVLFSQKGNWVIKIEEEVFNINSKDTFSIPLNTKITISVNNSEDCFLNCVSKA